MRRAVAGCAAVLGVFLGVLAPSTVFARGHGRGHRPGCWTARCDRWADREWAEHHRPAFHILPVEACEANYESGEPGSRDPRFINWRMENAGYEGGFSWLPSTWQAQRFPGYPSRAVDATPEQQVLVFRRYKNVAEWPPLANC